MSEFPKDIIIAKHFESLHDGDLTMIGLQPKMDAIGIWTEGYGKAIRYKGVFLEGIENKELAYSLATIKTVEEAEADLVKRYIRNELEVIKRLKVMLNDDQIKALALHYDNCGVSGTLYKLVNKEPSDSPKIKEWWTRHYITGGGVELGGLVRRRKSEYHLFMTGEINLFNP